MFTAPQVAELLFGCTSLLLAVWGVVWRLNTSLKADLHDVIGQLRESHDSAVREMTTAHEKQVAEARTQYAEIGRSVQAINLQINTILEGNMRRLEDRVVRLESGQDEWTKALRQRTHDLGDALNRMQMEIALIKANFSKADGAAS